MSLFTQTSERSTQKEENRPSGRRCSSEDSRAKILAWQERAQASTEKGRVFGGNTIESLAWFDPDTSSWKTSQLSFTGDCQPFSERFPRSGMMQNGRLYRRQRSVPRTLENVSSLWPTPAAWDGKRGARKPNGKRGMALSDLPKAEMWPTPTVSSLHNRKGASPTSGDGLSTAAKKRWPTPMASSAKGPSDAEIEAGNPKCRLETEVHCRPGQEETKGSQTPSQPKRKEGKLSVIFVEWLMGFPIGWTALEDAETPSSPT